MVVRDYEWLNFALFLATRDGGEFRVERERERERRDFPFSYRDNETFDTG